MKNSQTTSVLIMLGQIVHLLQSLLQSLSMSQVIAQQTKLARLTLEEEGQC